MINRESEKKNSIPRPPHPMEPWIFGAEVSVGAVHLTNGTILGVESAVVGSADRVVKMQPEVDRITREKLGLEMPFTTGELSFLRDNLGLSSELSIASVLLTGALLAADAVRRWRKASRYNKYIGR